MQFTPQQLAGYKGFSPGVLIGNWSEDAQLRQEKLHLARIAAAQGNALTQRLPLTPLPVASSGILVGSITAVRFHTGCTTTALFNNSSGIPNGYLSFARSTRGPTIVVSRVGGVGAAPVSGGFESTCERRSCWVAHPKKGGDGAGDQAAGAGGAGSMGDASHTGAKDRVTMGGAGAGGGGAELLNGAPFYLVNELLGDTVYVNGDRSTTGTYEVTAASASTGSGLWIAVAAEDNASAQARRQGATIRPGEPIYLLHAMSRRYLCMAPKGGIDGEPLAALLEKPTGCWTFAAAPPGTSFTDPRATKLDDFRQRVLSRTANEGLKGLERSLRLMDRDKSGSLSIEELARGFSRLGISLTPQEAQTILLRFDHSGDKIISIPEFFRGIRGNMSEGRQQLVVLAFGQMDRQHRGFVSFAELVETFRSCQGARKPPLSAADLEASVAKFISAWDRNADGTVTLGEFLEYYEDISCTVERDDYFELMIRNAWHLSGGSGWAENTTCRRVLVHHVDGRQTVEEIKNDLGLGAHDIEAIKSRLVQQGITDIERIELTG